MGIRLGPAVVLTALLAFGGVRAQRTWAQMKHDLAVEETAVKGLEGEVSIEHRYLAALQDQTSQKSHDPAWLTDLDALTRLLPEDTRLVSMEWTPQRSQLDLMTPHPVRIQEILEASPEFKGVRFLGNLDRRSDLSRLTLRVESEAAR